jgi:hypothetical protein
MTVELTQTDLFELKIGYLHDLKQLTNRHLIANTRLVCTLVGIRENLEL